MNAPATLSKVQRLRARDGDACWLRTLPLDFAAAPNSKRAATIEHLIAKSLGGGGEMTNLALCHQGCNLHLADKPLAKKQEIRAKWHANAAAVKATKSKPSGPSRTTTVQVPPSATRPAPTQSNISPAELRRWQLFGLGSAGLFLLTLGFTVGLLVGG